MSRAAPSKRLMRQADLQGMRRDQSVRTTAARSGGLPTGAFSDSSRLTDLRRSLLTQE